MAPTKQLASRRSISTKDMLKVTEIITLRKVTTNAVEIYPKITPNGTPNKRLVNQMVFLFSSPNRSTHTGK
jgi:hypothetical protein